MKHILIADDEPHMARVLQQVLERAGYTVKTVRNGLEALQAVRNRQPDILVTDIQMPIMNGKALCETLAVELPQREFPIFVMTSMTDREHREWTAEIAGITLLEKPLSTRLLIQRFQTHFDQTKISSAGP
jgi:CheY-like chemotaxis protein